MWPLASFVLRSARDTLKRFPAPLAAAAVTSALLIDGQHEQWSGRDPILFTLAASLGLPLGTALTLLAERPPRWLARVWAPRLWAFLVTALALVAYGVELDGRRGQGDAYIMRYAQLSCAAHLAVAVAPFMRRTEGVTRGVWQLGRHLFLRLPLSAVYALVVFGGLALALAAVVNLFDVDIDEDRYFELWVVCTFILQTWHFLAGIPKDFEALTRDDAYPRALRIFAQFVLLPLLGLYLFILYAYAAKISISGSLPVGWVGWMVSAAGAFGMLALLLLFPARQGPLGRFVRRVETAFHLGILPLLGLLFVSLWVRVEAYGITEPRYFLAVLGVWLAAASIYRLRWGRRSLAWIPASLCLVALVTSVGPWGALAVSRESQSRRLTALLQKNDRMTGPSKRGAVVSADDEREMSRILDYLVETHGSESMRPWPGPNGPTQSVSDFLSVRDLEYVERHLSRPDTLSFYGALREPLDIEGYDWLVPFELYSGSSRAPESGRFALSLAQDDLAILVSDGGTPRGTISLLSVIERAKNDEPHGKAPAEPISVEAGGLKLKLVITHLQAERRGQRWVVQSCGGNLLVGK